MQTFFHLLIVALKKELDQFDKDCGKVEKNFFELLNDSETENWATRICDLYESITDSKEKILLSTKTLQRWLSQMR